MQMSPKAGTVETLQDGGMDEHARGSNEIHC